MGISTARTGARYGLYCQDSEEGLIPILPFPPVPRKPTLPELAKRMSAPKTLGEKIRFLRLSRGLRQNVLATTLGVCNTAVCQWEKDSTAPRPELMSRLAKMLGVSKARLTLPISAGS